MDTTQINPTPPIVPNAPTPAHRNRMLISVFVITLLISIIAIPLFIMHFSQKKVPAKITQAPAPLAKQHISIKNVLISYVPHFSHLLLSDLPSVSQYSSYMQVFPYKNTLLLVGANKIIQIDATSQKILRTLNTDVFDCIYRSALIGSNLYTYCQEYKGSSSTKIKRGIYVLNLEKNEISEKYVDQKTYVGVWPDPGYAVQNKYLTLVNTNFVVQGTILWIGTWDRVIQLNTLNGKIQIYTPSQLGFIGQCYSFGINTNQKYVYVTAADNGSYCPHGGISLYFPKTNTWKNYIETSFPDYS